MHAIAAAFVLLAAPAGQEVRALIESIQGALAKHDRAALESATAPEFALLHSTGKLEPRASFLDRAGKGELLSQRIPWERLEDQLRLFGDCTAVRTTRIVAHPPGKPELSIRSIDVYAKIDGRWRWVSEQSTPL